MISYSDAIETARNYAKRHKMGWSESDLRVEESLLKDKPCLIIYTATIDLESVSWLEQETSTPLRFFVDPATGKCFAYEYGDRGIQLQN